MPTVRGSELAITLLGEVVSLWVSLTEVEGRLGVEVEEAGSARRIDPIEEGVPCTVTELMAEVLAGEELLGGEGPMADLDVSTFLLCQYA